ncbi:MAG: cell division protein FtsW [Flavobacteriales bacterium]|nr:cell division protein FtsW [Flavobacteriales bacterium]|tara:strand:+ start:28219 stop:29343 length:1125 start_codon:yes stop_codon:yes gene_type:complete
MHHIFENIKLRGDKTIWIIVFLLSLFSVMVVYSAAGWVDLTQHIFKLSLGLICMYIVHLIPFKYFSKLGQLGYFTSLVLLILVLLIGVTINGASRWIELAGLRFQPSDVAKLTVILFMARQISINRENLDRFKEFAWYILFPLLIVCVLILPNNFSTSALVFINGIVLMFIGRVKIAFITKVLALSFLVSGVIYAATKYTSFGERVIPRSETWVSRIDSYFVEVDEVDKDYQQMQALVAIQNGGIKGVGPGKSTQRSILPYSESDFIYAIILEEYGLLGGVVAILLYLILLFRAVRISLKVNSIFGSLIVVGLIFSLVFQALINMLVSVEIFPVTGQTLPLISMGGTSIVFTCISIGIVLSVSRNSLMGEYEKS